MISLWNLRHCYRLRDINSWLFINASIIILHNNINITHWKVTTLLALLLLILWLHFAAVNFWIHRGTSTEVKNLSTSSTTAGQESTERSTRIYLYYADCGRNQPEGLCGGKMENFHCTWSSRSRTGGACASTPPPPWPVGRAGLWTREPAPAGRPPVRGGCWPLTARAEALSGGPRGP